MARKSKKMFRSPKLARRQARKRRSQISERRKKEFLWRGYTMWRHQGVGSKGLHQVPGSGTRDWHQVVADTVFVLD